MLKYMKTKFGSDHSEITKVSIALWKLNVTFICIKTNNSKQHSIHILYNNFNN